MSIWDIAVRYKLDTFLDFHRLTPLYLTMWFRYRYLDPKKHFVQVEYPLSSMFTYMRKYPAMFYYSPVRYFLTSVSLYVLYVVFVTAQSCTGTWARPPKPGHTWRRRSKG